jgi:hypothetical protein
MYKESLRIWWFMRVGGGKGGGGGDPACRHVQIVFILFRYASHYCLPPIQRKGLVNDDCYLRIHGAVPPL